MMLTPGPKKGKTKKDHDPFMLLAKYKAGGKSTPKKQLGGLGNMFGIDTGTLNGIMSGLEGVDFNNYQSVLGAGEKIGGQNFMDAIAADDPSKIGGLKEMSAALAKSQKPVWTPGTPEYNAEFDRRVAERGVDTIPNGQDRVRIKSMIHEEMKREGQRNAQFGQRTQTINNMAGATGQAAGLNSLLGIIDGFQMQQGGAVSKLGYSDNSPYKNLPAINIPGNTITMAGYTQGAPTEHNKLNIVPGSHVTGTPMRDGLTVLTNPIFRGGGLGPSRPLSNQTADVQQPGAVAIMERQVPFIVRGAVVEGEFEVDTLLPEDVKWLADQGYKVDIVNE